MKRATASALLERFGGHLYYAGRYDCYILNGYRIEWRPVYDWIRDVTWQHPGGRYWNPEFPRYGDKGKTPRNGIKVKRFIDMALGESKYVGQPECQYRIDFGPDWTLNLTRSVRLFGQVPGTKFSHYLESTPRLRLTDADVVGMAQNVFGGDMPPEVYIDWLKDQGILGG